MVYMRMCVTLIDVYLLFHFSIVFLKEKSFYDAELVITKRGSQKVYGNSKQSPRLWKYVTPHNIIIKFVLNPEIIHFMPVALSMEKCTNRIQFLAYIYLTQFFLDIIQEIHFAHK